MKKSVVFLAIIFFGLSSFTIATDKPDRALVKQVSIMLENLPLEIDEEILVEVKLKVNHQNLIEVLSVEAEDPLVRKLIKKRLNNKTLAAPIKAEGSYLLPIKIEL